MTDNEFYYAVNEACKLDYRLDVETSGYRAVYEGAARFLAEEYPSAYFERQDDIEAWFEEINLRHDLHLRNLELAKKVGPIEDGTLPWFTFPGGYPILYYDKQGDAFCAKCAEKDALIVDADAYYEGPPAYCCDCGTIITSAYGDPDAEEEDDD